MTRAARGAVTTIPDITTSQHPPSALCSDRVEGNGHELQAHAQLARELVRHLDVEADQLAGGVEERVRRVVAPVTHAQALRARRCGPAGSPSAGSPRRRRRLAVHGGGDARTRMRSIDASTLSFPYSWAIPRSKRSRSPPSVAIDRPGRHHQVAHAAARGPRGRGRPWRSRRGWPGSACASRRPRCRSGS